jgi:hypothetical protein
MSYPPISNVQNRLTEENGMTRLKFTLDRIATGDDGKTVICPLQTANSIQL